MSSLSVFNFKSNEVRVVLDESGNPLFVAKDVATALGYKRPNDAIQQFCKGAVKYRTLQTDGGKQKIRTIYEPDVYRLIFGSQLESAVEFQNWTFEEVLPAIRKTGRYELTPSKLINTTKTDRIPLKDAVTRLIAVTKMMNYPQAYELVHKAFGVDSITEIPKDKLHVATMYVNGLVGEYIPYEKPKTIEVPKDCVAVKKDQLQRIVHHISYLSDVVNTLYPLLRGLHSPMAGSLIGHMQEIQCCANILKRQHGLVARITP